MASCLHDDTHKSLPTVAQICSETAGGKPRVERPANLLEKPMNFWYKFRGMLNVAQILC